MFVNKITLKELSWKMYHVYTSHDFDTPDYSDCFNQLMREYNFRYKSENDLSAELLCELGNDSVEDLFLDKINRMDINEKIFYDIAFEFIEPMKVEDHLLIPNRLIPANF